MTDLDTIREALHDATIAAEAACAVLARSEGSPFARVLLRQMQQSAALAREARDTFARALLEVGRAQGQLTTGKQVGELKP